MKKTVKILKQIQKKRKIDNESIEHIRVVVSESDRSYCDTYTPVYCGDVVSRHHPTIETPELVMPAPIGTYTNSSLNPDARVWSTNRSNSDLESIHGHENIAKQPLVQSTPKRPSLLDSRSCTDETHQEITDVASPADQPDDQATSTVMQVLPDLTKSYNNPNDSNPKLTKEMHLAYPDSPKPSSDTNKMHVMLCPCCNTEMTVGHVCANDNDSASCNSHGDDSPIMSLNPTSYSNPNHPLENHLMTLMARKLGLKNLRHNKESTNIWKNVAAHNDKYKQFNCS